MGEKLLTIKPIEKAFFIFVFLTIAVMSRILLYPEVFPDFVQFLNPWLNALREYGLVAINNGISNYNTPYLLLLWLFSRVIPSNLAVIKTIALISDILMAVGVFKTVEIFKPEGFTKYLAALSLPILPTVAYNSAAWGQCDGIMGMLAIWAIFFCLKDKLHFSWILAGIAFAVKMQGVFLAPFLLAISVNRRKTFITGPLLAVASCFIFSTPTLIRGDTLERIFGVFVDGSGAMFGVKHLSWWMSNLCQWFPNQYYDEFRFITIGIGFAIVVLLVIYGLRSRIFSNERCLLIASFCLIVLPFVLPQMHGRYYYQGEIALFVLAFILPRTAWFVYIIQMVTMSTFFIANTGVDRDNWAFRILSIGVLAILVGLIRMNSSLVKSEANNDLLEEENERVLR